MRLVCLVVVFFHRQACLLGGQTTNRIFNYAADIPAHCRQRMIRVIARAFLFMR